MRIRIVQKPSVSDLDGVDLSVLQVGTEYDLGVSIASVLLAEGWAEPLPLDAPPPPVPFGPDDRFGMPVIRDRPPPSSTGPHRPFLDRGVAADFPRRPRRRKT
jgi:hypothetical protein